MLEGDLKNLNSFLQSHLEVCPLVNQGGTDLELPGGSPDQGPSTEDQGLSAAQRLVNSPLPQELIDDLFYG